MNRARVAVFVVFVSLGLGAVAGGCHSGSPPYVLKPVPASASPQQNVMVIDEGFDLSISELQGLVSAAYTETCADDSGSGSLTGDAGAVDSGPQFDMLKQEFLSELAEPDDSCQLSTGIVDKPDPLASIAQYRARWNAMIEANEYADEVFNTGEITQLMTALDNEFMTFDYHGTSTAGTVAHENPNVRLVLVEIKLSSESALQASFTCFVQSDIDQLVDLFTDPQVNAAAVNQPAQIDGELADAMTTHGVGVVNESFGAEARTTLETLQTMSGCSPIDLSAYFSVLDQIANDHAATIAGPKVLTVVAAGNDGAEIDTGADSLSCDLGAPLSLLVGAYDPSDMTRNTFSNYGACVGLYAPGQAVVAPYAGDWLLPVAGTSFASPMTVRQVSLVAASPYDPAAAKTALLAETDANQNLPVALFPADFFYVPAETPLDAIVPGNLARGSSQRPPTEVDLHRVMGPLARLHRLQRR